MVRWLFIFLLSGCAVTGGYSRLPDPVTDWLETNTWRVDTPSTGGTGFWIDDTFITACHIVAGFPVAYIHNIDKTRLTLTKVSSCDPVRDIAVLVPIESPNNRMPGDFKPRSIGMPDEMPAPGTLIYSAGWELGGPFGYTRGVLNSKTDNGYEAAMHMVYGDSGSPVVALQAGQPKLIGILLSFTSIRLPARDSGETQDILIFGSTVLHGVDSIRAVLQEKKTR